MYREETSKVKPLPTRGYNTPTEYPKNIDTRADYIRTNNLQHFHSYVYYIPTKYPQNFDLYYIPTRYVDVLNVGRNDKSV